MCMSVRGGGEGWGVGTFVREGGLEVEELSLDGLDVVLILYLQSRWYSYSHSSIEVREKKELKLYCKC